MKRQTTALASVADGKRRERYLGLVARRVPAVRSSMARLNWKLSAAPAQGAVNREALDHAVYRRRDGVAAVLNGKYVTVSPRFTPVTIDVRAKPTGVGINRCRCPPRCLFSAGRYISSTRRTSAQAESPDRALHQHRPKLTGPCRSPSAVPPMVAVPVAVVVRARADVQLGQSGSRVVGN